MTSTERTTESVPPGTDGGSAFAARRLVRDLPVRVFHWALVLCLAASWITAEAGIEWTPVHFWCGYTALTLVLFRVLWLGFGTLHARLPALLAGPAAVLRDLRALPGPGLGHEGAGHTPAGGYMILVLLALVLVQAGTGLFTSDDIFYAGPWNGAVASDTADWLGRLHHSNFSLLQAAVALHVLAVLWYSLRKRHALLRPMITGTRPAAEVTERQAIGSAATWRGLAVLALAAGIVTALVLLAPPPAAIDYY